MDKKQQKWTKWTRVYTFLICLLISIFIMTLFVGETPWILIRPSLFTWFKNPTVVWNPLLDERLPRAIVLLCTGASLAVAGIIMQSIFQNPLASPDILGMISGGSLASSFVFVLGWHLYFPFLASIASVLGCLLALLIIFAINHSLNYAKYSNLHEIHAINNSQLLLIGIAFSMVLLAIQGALHYAIKDQWHLSQMVTEWLAGSTLDRNWNHVHMQLPLTIVGLMGSWKYRAELNLLSLGEEEANRLGVEVNKIRMRLFFCVALLLGGSLAGLGVIPFFGFLVPQLGRIFLGCDHRLLIPFCFVTGSILLLAFDIALRLLSIHMLSISHLFGFVGGLFFLIMLVKRNQMFGEAPC